MAHQKKKKKKRKKNEYDNRKYLFFGYVQNQMKVLQNMLIKFYRKNLMSIIFAMKSFYKKQKINKNLLLMGFKPKKWYSIRKNALIQQV